MISIKRIGWSAIRFQKIMMNTDIHVLVLVLACLRLPTCTQPTIHSFIHSSVRPSDRFVWTKRNVLEVGGGGQGGGEGGGYVDVR